MPAHICQVARSARGPRSYPFLWNTGLWNAVPLGRSVTDRFFGEAIEDESVEDGTVVGRLHVSLSTGCLASCCESVDACPNRDSCPGPGRRRALTADHLYSRWAVTPVRLDSISILDIRTGEPHRTRTVPRPKATWYRPQDDPLACYTSHSNVSGGLSVIYWYRGTWHSELDTCL